MSKLFVLLIFTNAIAFNAYGTINGPSCGELTEAQNSLIEAAAIKYIQNKQSATLAISQVKAEQFDCHDYDGVHSQSEFTVEWVQVEESQRMQCSQNVAVEADYDSEKKLKKIDETTEFFVDETDDVNCVN